METRTRGYQKGESVTVLSGAATALNRRGWSTPDAHEGEVGIVAFVFDDPLHVAVMFPNGDEIGYPPEFIARATAPTPTTESHDRP
jgi:hypothetical protein